MILYYFRKMGGQSFIKKLLYNNVLLYSVLMFLFLPKNRFGLEILSELIEKKIENKLKKKYKCIVDNANKEFPQNINNKIVWVCWLQGIENAPALVKMNLKRLYKYFPDYTICIITSKNYKEFTELPEFIIQKYQAGIISHTHFSDILRTNLLSRNGGIWVDATVYATGFLPFDIAKAPFFLFRTQKPGCAGKCITVSSWFISCVQNHPVMLLVQDLLFEYWKNNNYLCDYFLFHLFIEIALEHYKEFIKDMPSYSNEEPHLLMYELPEPFDKEIFEKIKRQSFVHKLTIKMTEEEKRKVGTFYTHLLSNEEVN